MLDSFFGACVGQLLHNVKASIISRFCYSKISMYLRVTK